MSTLYFSYLSQFVLEDDWSSLPDTDKELPLEDDYSEESDAEIDFTWEDLLY